MQFYYEVNRSGPPGWTRQRAWPGRRLGVQCQSLPPLESVGISASRQPGSLPEQGIQDFYMVAWLEEWPGDGTQSSALSPPRGLPGSVFLVTSPHSESAG